MNEADIDAISSITSAVITTSLVVFPLGYYFASRNVYRMTDRARDSGIWSMRHDAITHGAAEWRIHPESGKRWFAWRTKDGTFKQSDVYTEDN